ncbi:hypothetical protein CC1G_11197 [Coprinopsis cinerea okayama7|uniref:Uncharacterized protein n=1 Tax=Coprinopsis cinerea (strain Okayama-7 / 130 / ATCC MYA-4618 / FGSC 9003) TaxID=240176 RepID=A8NJS9_COPC7|nr:hypothetical protein CC1G_11197 [Coprinopsis cinerea okayama7\|eukprot:XP_001834284.1 hypothetical protein CC1G_11197 [Coprinopsis cinerea okayama7\
MSAPSKQLAQKLSTIADAWVRDPFRPNIQLSTFLKSLADHPKLTPQAVQAARALQKNEIKKAYPLSDKMLRPASMPQHYERLLEGYKKSQQGIGRPWWKVFFGIW